MAQVPAVVERRSLVRRTVQTVRGAFRTPVARSDSSGGFSLMAGWLPALWGNSWNWWQRGYDPIPYGDSPIVHACVSAYSQTMAMCPGTHWVTTGDGGRARVTASALSRVLVQPNGYQSISDFMLNLTRCLYRDGNAYALALRNARSEVAELHLMNPRSCSAKIVPSTGDIFYQLGGNAVVEKMFGMDPNGYLDFVPARDVLHIRLDTPTDPLKGVPPLTSALIDVAAGNAMIRQALHYAENQGRPSGVLQSDLVLTKEQVAELRERWNEQVQGVNIGGTPILTAGLKWNQVTVAARDAQLAEILQISDQRIATAYRVPLAILSLLTGNGPQGSTESLMQFWIATGFGFCANHIEEGFGRFFRLRGYPDEYLEFSTSALLRSNFKDRIEALARAVQGGIYAPNEARAEEDLPAKEYGDEPRVQQQVVPLSFAGKVPPVSPAAPPSTPPAPNTPSSPPAAPAGGQQNAGAADLAQRILAAADRYDRRRDAA